MLVGHSPIPETNIIRQRKLAGKLPNPGSPGSERLKWDLNVADRMLYLYNPIILVKCAILLLFTIRPLTPPTRTISCLFPKEFTFAYMKYGRDRCLGGTAPLYQQSVKYNSSVPSTVLQPGEATAYEQIENVDALFSMEDPPESEIFTSRLFLLAAVSLAPLVCWRLVGYIDGAEFTVSSTINRHVLIMWYILTKVGAVAICVTSLLMVIDLCEEGDNYLRIASKNRQPQDVLVMCDFWVRQSGGNLHRYTVQCTLSQGRDPLSYVLDILYGLEHVLSPLLTSLKIWLVSLLIAVSLNALSVFVLAALCTRTSYRTSFIKRNVETQESGVYFTLDRRLGIEGIVVCSLATKNGQGLLVSALIREMSADGD